MRQTLQFWSEKDISEVLEKTLTRTVPFLLIDKLGIERIRCRERAQKVSNYTPTCGIPAFRLRLFDE